MRRSTVLAIALLAAALTASVFASTPLPGRQPWETNQGASSTAVTSSLECFVRVVETNRILQITGEWGEGPIKVTQQVEIRAQSKKDFEGRKDLEFGDLAVGQKLRVFFKTETGDITQIRVLKSKTWTDQWG